MAREIERMILDGWSLTTAQIFYYLPDRPRIIAPEFIWQEYDLAPEFPELRRFLAFWRREIEGRIHSVQVASRRLISPGECRVVTLSLQVH